MNMKRKKKIEIDLLHNLDCHLMKINGKDSCFHLIYSIFDDTVLYLCMV